MDKEETAPEFDPFAEAEAKPSPKRGGSLLGGLALLVALGVAGWNGWTWWQDRQAADLTAEVERSLADLQSSQAALERAQSRQDDRLESVEGMDLSSSIASLDQAVARAESVAGSDRARLQGVEEELGDTMERLDAVEGRLAAVVVRGETPRQGLDLAEVDYLLRSANERLRLYDDARTADQALALADEQLAALDDPVYLSVRQSIAAARLSLESVDEPDTIALTEGLGQLQGQIPGLPFPGEVVVETETGALDTVEDPGVWARFTAAVSGLVSVRRQASDESLVSLEDKDYVRQGLWLQLEAARLALLRADDTAWQAALARAQATLDQYFESSAAEAERFSAGLERAASVSLAVDWPDISEPWTRLQAIRSVSGESSAQPAALPAAQSIERAPEPAEDADPTPGEDDAAAPADNNRASMADGVSEATDGGDASAPSEATPPGVTEDDGEDGGS